MLRLENIDDLTGSNGALAVEACLGRRPVFGTLRTSR